MPLLDNEVRPMSQNFLSTLDPLLEDFDIGKEIYPAFGNQRANAYVFLKGLGAQAPISQETGHHFETTRLQQLITVQNTVVGAAGAPITFTIDPSSMNGSYSYVRKFFTMVLPGNILGSITDVSALPNVTITPFNATDVLSVTAGDSYPVGPSAFGEGTNQPKGVVNRLVRRDFQLSIMKEAYIGSNTAATNSTSVNASSALALGPLLGDQGNAMGLGNTLMLRGQKETDFRMSVQIGENLYIGQRNTNAALFDNDPNAVEGVIRSTQGLERTTLQFGGNLPYTVGTMSMADFDAVGAYMESQNVSAEKPILWMHSYDQYVEFENMMVANQAATLIRYDKDVTNEMIFGKRSKDIDINFKRLTKSNYTYALMEEPLFTDPVALGAPSLDNRNLGFMIPLAQVTDGDKKLRDSMAIRYKALGSMNRMFSMWTRGQDITNYDISELQMQANLGFEFFGANRFVRFKGN